MQTTWMSWRGKRWIDRVEGDFIIVRTEGDPNEAKYYVKDQSTLDRIIARDQVAPEVRAQAYEKRVDEEKKKEAAEAVALAAREVMLNAYLSTLPTMQAGKVGKDLRRQASFGRSVMPRYEFAERSIGAGYRVDTNAEGQCLVSPDGSYYRAKDITKTVIDYARFLLLSRK